LVAGGVPVAGGVGVEFLERTSVRAGLAWLRLAGAGGGPLSPTDLAEALRRPARPLHPNVAKWVGEQSSLEGLHRLAKRLTTERESERVDAFADDIARLQTIIGRGGTTGLVLATLRDTMGLESTVATLDVHRHGMNRASQNDDLTALAQLGRMQPDAKLFESWLRGALRTPWQPDGVTLATVHRVKGQEWPMVVVHHADIDQFPHRLADDIEEERRLFHVAITRAAEHATIVVAERPSPFIAELTTEPSATIAADDDQGVRGPMFSRGGDRTSSGAGSSASGRAARSAAPPTRPGQQLQGDDAALFEELRAVRRHLAAGKPAYTVVADATLAAIAEARPASLAELARIRGIGPSKLEQYGAALLAAVESATNSAPQ
ncbi:MAG: HRDC domain-containing protein, partial [Ilumatobacteraceae bacterium]